MAGTYHVHNAGSKSDVPADEADRLIAAGFAELYESDDDESAGKGKGKGKGKGGK